MKNSLHQVLGSPTRSGPEAKLVWEFIFSTLVLVPVEGKRTVFIEKPIGPYRPDIVVVDWNHSVSSMWLEERSRLSAKDLRLAHLLYTAGPTHEQELKTLFPRGLRKSLSRLDEAGIITQQGAFWSLRDISQVFAVFRILSFEAKISSMGRAVEQAFLNSWFASESYILTSRKTTSKSIKEMASNKGIGIWQISGSIGGCIMNAKCLEIPQSYGSWIFNELAWRAFNDFGLSL